MHEIRSQKEGHKRLAELQLEHRALNEVIVWLTEHRPVNQLQIQRLKKRQLTLKDKIAFLERLLIPDIIA